MDTTDIALEHAVDLATEVVKATNDWLIADVVSVVMDAVTTATVTTATDDGMATVATDAVVMATDDVTQPEYVTSCATDFSCECRHRLV